jgi:F-type H+-transporting ATPase subunit b
MGFTWSTFILEIINFLILVWVLKRLLYVPIKKVILQRKETIQETLKQAEKLRGESKELQEKYENRLKDWEMEKEEKQKVFQQEMEKEKARQLSLLQESLKKEREIMSAREQQRIQTLINKNLQKSLSLAAQFSAQFLKRLATPELEIKIIEIFCDDFMHLSSSELSELIENLTHETIDIETAYSIADSQKELLLKILKKVLGDQIQCNFNMDPNLLSGISIRIGSHQLQANLRDELKFFTEVSYESFPT